MIILVVDELLRVEELTQGRVTSREVLQSLSAAMSAPGLPPLCVVVSSLSPALEDLQQTASGRPLVKIQLPPIPLIDGDGGIQKLCESASASLRMRELLSETAYKSLLQDTGGVPRMLEYVFLDAKIRAESPPDDLPLTRDAVLRDLLKNPAVLRLGGADASVVSALEAVFLGWRAGPEHEIETSCLIDKLVQRGSLHVRPSSYSEYIPPLLFRTWAYRQTLRQHPILRATRDFLFFDDPVTYREELFEVQLAGLWSLAYACDVVYRSPATEHAGEQAFLRAITSGPRSWTLFDMLCCGRKQAAGCCSDKSNCRTRLMDRLEPPPPPTARAAAMVSELDPEEPALLSRKQPSDFVPLDEERPTQAQLKELWQRLPLGLNPQKFYTASNLEQLPIGLSVPKLTNNPGFDLLDVELMLESNHARFYIAIEARFTTEEASSYLELRAVASKVILALESYPTLAVACREGRFCFVIATFQEFAAAHTASVIASEVTKMVKTKEAALQKKQEETKKQEVEASKEKEKTKTRRRQQQRTPQEPLLLSSFPTEQQIEASLLVLRRAHLEMLLTPSLSTRLQFLEPSRAWDAMLLRRRESEERAAEQAKAKSKQAETGGDSGCPAPRSKKREPSAAAGAGVTVLSKKAKEI
jgi:hypothetical protein